MKKKTAAIILLAIAMMLGSAFAEEAVPTAEVSAAAAEAPEAAETETPAPAQTGSEAENAVSAEERTQLLSETPDLTGITPAEGTDTTYLVVETAGMMETVAQSVFTQEKVGFSFLFDSDYLSVYDTLNEDCTAGAVYVNPSDPENTDLISIQIVPASILGITVQDFLNEVPMSFGLDDLGQMDQIVMDSGVEFSFRAGFKGDMYFMFFTLTDGQTELCMLVRYPLDVIESYGARFDRLIWSTTFTDKEAQIQ